MQLCKLSTCSGTDTREIVESSMPHSVYYFVNGNSVLLGTGYVNTLGWCGKCHSVQNPFSGKTRRFLVRFALLNLTGTEPWY